MNRYNVSPIAMGRIPLEGLSWLRGESLQGHVQFGVECGPVQYENKIGTTKGIHSLNL
jgi:hypothetical protein